MNDESLKGKIVKLFIKKSGKHRIPQFRVRLESGKVEDFGRGKISTETFGGKYDKMTSAQMQKHIKKDFYGLKVGDAVVISTQVDWE